MTETAHSLELTRVPVARVQMGIRRPVADVFEAFVDPAITSKFWFTKGSGRLRPGARVQWDWEMYGVSTMVTVREFEQDRRIRIDWSDEAPTTVEWDFTSLPDGTTLVTITNSGFRGSGDEVAAQAMDSMGGFSMVLAGLKALLEHDISLNLVADQFPAGIDAH
ncbi:MAG: SRPBCC family protein [Thermomicrobiales bacterium]